MRRFIAPAIFLLLTVACTAGLTPPPKTAADHFQEGEALFESGLYEDAIASWEKVRESYYSPEMNILAEKKIAEAHFLAGNFLEAALAYEDFLKQHPGHTDTGEILYQLGMSYYRQMLDSDRDQTATRNALSTFNSLLQRFPETPKKTEIMAAIAACRAKLADHELYVGRFYLQYGRPEAAIRRLQDLFVTYPDFAGRDEAYFLLGKAYLKIDRKKEAVEAFNTLYAQFPNSEFAVQAQKALARYH